MNTKSYDRITERIVTLMEQGTVPWHKPWQVKTGMPRNLITQKPYRGINTFLLMCQGYESPNWLTFRGIPVFTCHGLCQGTVPCSMSPTMRSVMRSYDLVLLAILSLFVFVNELCESTMKRMTRRDFVGDAGTCRIGKVKKASHTKV